MSLKYVVGDATAPQGEGSKLIVHCVNDIGQWGSGFVVALSKRWKRPELEYRAWARGGSTTVDGRVVPFLLGEVQFVSVEPDICVANIVGQHKNIQAGEKTPIRYEALGKGLRRAADFCKLTGTSMHGPRLGAGLAQGSWPDIEQILFRIVGDYGIDITIYDMPKR